MIHTQTLIDCGRSRFQRARVSARPRVVPPPAKAPFLPEKDNAEGAIEQLLAANALYRKIPWPAPYRETTHQLLVRDARDLTGIADESVHLVVTSPPYWNLKEYNHRDSQLGDVANYEEFLNMLDRAWAECFRVLVPGGRVCCVVGDVCVPRRREGHHYVAPLHSDIQVRVRRLGFDCLTGISWRKIANASREAEGNGAGFLGKPYQPGAIIKNDAEFILFFRKPGDYRTTPMIQKALSMLSKDEMKSWLVSSWNVKGASTKGGHPAPYPPEIAERLIRLFSFAGDTVLDPFVGTGSTSIAAIQTGRNSIGSDIDPTYVATARARCRRAIAAAGALGNTLPTLKE